jgi:hypothetical protein
MIDGEVSARPLAPGELGRLVDDFVWSTPGATHALIVMCERPSPIASVGLPAALVGPLTAATSGLISLARESADDGGCDQILLRLPHGHFVFRRIGDRAGVVALVAAGARLDAVADSMARLVAGAARLLARPVRDGPP